MENQTNFGEPSPGAPTPGQSPAPQTEQNRTLFGILAYLGPLVIVSYLLSKQDPFVKFHVKQGLVVFSMEVIVWILGALAWPLWMFWSLINLFAFVLSVVGIINVLQKKEKELPVVGKFSSHFPV
ncbi:MAG: hypothetical protein AAB410_03935 [Patescibacteria group bacterium]